MRSTVWLKWQLAYLSLNTRLPTQVILLSMTLSTDLSCLGGIFLPVTFPLFPRHLHLTEHAHGHYTV